MLWKVSSQGDCNALLDVGLVDVNRNEDGITSVRRRDLAFQFNRSESHLTRVSWSRFKFLTNCYDSIGRLNRKRSLIGQFHVDNC